MKGWPWWEQVGAVPPCGGAICFRIVATWWKLWGLCDINSKRAAASQKFIGINAPLFVDFDQMVNTTKPDRVVVATVDATHYRYIIRAMELGYDVITEKPLGTDEEQCQSILDAEKRLGRKVTVAFNARHLEGRRKSNNLRWTKLWVTSSPCITTSIWAQTTAPVISAAGTV